MRRSVRMYVHKNVVNPRKLEVETDELSREEKVIRERVSVTGAH